MKTTKRTMMALICLCAMLLSLVMPTCVQPVEAATKNVTESMKVDKDFRYICRHINVYVAADGKLDNGTKPIRSKQINLTKSKKVDIVCASITAKGHTAAIHYKDTIRNKSYVHIRSAAIKAVYKKLFGESVNLNSLKLKGKNLSTIKKSGKYYYKMGDWGDGVPDYTIREVRKLSDGRYQALIVNRFRNLYTKKFYFTQGYTRIGFRKTKTGYKVTGLAYSNAIVSAPLVAAEKMYDSIISNLVPGQAYTVVDLSETVDALLVTDYTYFADGSVAAISAKVFAPDGQGVVKECGQISSVGTAYPLRVSDHYIYYGSGHSVYKATLSPDDNALIVIESAEDAIASGTTSMYNGTPVQDDSNLVRLQNEWANGASTVNFIKVQ